VEALLVKSLKSSPPPERWTRRDQPEWRRTTDAGYCPALVSDPVLMLIDEPPRVEPDHVEKYPKY